jgi:hypothetical protein
MRRSALRTQSVPYAETKLSSTAVQSAFSALGSVHVSIQLPFWSPL